MSFSIDQFLEKLKTGFENLTVTYQQLDYNGAIPVFFVRFASLERMAADWVKLVDAIAFDFQSQLTDEFQIWNIYIFFSRPEGVTDMLSYNSLKLKIENDTFSSRKILVDEQDTARIINEHILNHNINFSTDRLAEPTVKFEPDPLLWSMLEDKILKRQKATGAAADTFEELVKQLKTPHP